MTVFGEIFNFEANSTIEILAFAAIFLIIFGVYVYFVFQSRKTVKLEKKQCTSRCDNLLGSCVVWNEADQKCYPGECEYSDDKKYYYCEENYDKNRLEDWQKNVLISSSIVFVLCVISYFFKE